MQVELLNRRRWNTRIELANAMFEYLEIWHNRHRRHSALGWLSPVEFETRNKIVAVQGFQGLDSTEPGAPQSVRSSAAPGSRSHTLGDTGGDQQAGRGCRPCGRAAQHERSQAEEEQAAPAEGVTQPSSWHERQAEGERVPGDHPLRCRRGGAQVLLQGGECHGADAEVQDAHEPDDQGHRQRSPAPRIGLVGVLGR
jgi:hypothetical protein